MSEKTQISINDFDLFCEVISSSTRIVESAKITINENGLQIYGARARTARCEILSNSVFSSKQVEFCVLDLRMFERVLKSIKDIHQGDMTDFKFIVDMPFLRF